MRIHHEQFIRVAREQHYGGIRGKPQAQWDYTTDFCLSLQYRPLNPSFDNSHLN